MKVIYGGGDEGHDPSFFLIRGQVQTSAEQPERAQILLEAAKRAGLEQEAPAAAALGPIAAVHTPEYLDFLSKASPRHRRAIRLSPGRHRLPDRPQDL